MKRNLLQVCLLIFAFSVSAQQHKIETRYPEGFRKAEVPEAIRNKGVILKLGVPLKNERVISNNNNLERRAENRNPNTISTTTVIETTVGYTYYDRQTLGSIGSRIVKDSGDTLSLTWNFSPNANANFPQLGPAYVYFDGFQWSLSPNTRVSSIRTLNPNIVTTNSDREMIFAQTNTHMDLIWHPSTSSASWTDDMIALGTGTNNDTWPKAVSDGDTIYSIWHGNGYSHVRLYGQDGPILFSKSIDAGVSWPILRQPIAEIDSNFYNGFGGENYSIDAKNGIVAIAFGSYGTDVGLLKSTDGGMTWSKTIIQQFPISHFRFDSMFTYLPGDTMVDTMDVNSGDPHVLIDNSGRCHVWFSQLRWLRDSSLAPYELKSFPYGSDNLYYWNENMAPGTYYSIATVSSSNGGALLNFANPLDTTCNLSGIYGGGLTEMPSAGIDASGVLYVTYQTIFLGCDTNDYHQMRKHVYMITSANNGQTWTYPFDIVPSGAQGGDGEHQEAVYAAMSKKVDNYAYVVYQRDPAPGMALSINGCTAANNSGASDIICTFVEALTVGMNTVHTDEFNVSQNFPNPTLENTSIIISLKKKADVHIFISDVFGKHVQHQSLKYVGNGMQTVNINTSEFPAGIYFYTVESEGLRVTKKMVVN